jgi:hypothetical protein
MTFQPPPPGDNPPPPPPPPGQWGGPQPGGRPAFDPKTVDPYDWAVLGLGLLTFIFSFFGYYKYSGGGISFTNSAWHGFFGWFGVLLILAATVLVGLELFMPQLKLPYPNRLIALGAWAVGMLFIILSIFIYPGSASYNGFSGSTSGADKSHGVPFWFLFIFALAGLVLSLMRAQQTGTRLPGPLANMPQIGPKQNPPQSPTA